eukprot:GHVU01046698.1.p1 GENE.GHVU01046698.1~~GHVU01046698.1.p1  ORF type:complete len:189 (+),score=22.57 GHVU01046698.1:291-857(+)
MCTSINLKLVIVGDRTADKTNLLITYTTGKYPNEYVPTVFDIYTAAVTLGGEHYQLRLFDTADPEDYDRLRPLSYPNTDVFVVVFSVVSRTSFGNVTAKWVPEITHHCPGTPFLIVGNEINKRNAPPENGGTPVSYGEGNAKAHKLGARRYLECSAQQQIGVNEVFNEAVIAALEIDVREKKQKCILL